MRPQTILCIATYFKGLEFMRECHRQGCRVYLLTAQKVAGEDWPREALEDVFVLPGNPDTWSRDMMIHSVSYLARTIKFDRIVPLDDYDLEKAALLREHMRVAGMGDTRTRYFRDKLAMRTQAAEAGIPVPDFVHVLNHDRVRAYTERVPPPWVLKPRSQASAAGIKKIRSTDELWSTVGKLGDEQSHYLLEAFVPGSIYHVDSIVFDEQVVFARAHRYTAPPMEVAHEGGIFSTHTIEHGSDEEGELLDANRKVMAAMGLRRGVSHTEFIRAEDSTFYFLETSARVGGAHIAEMLEASSGINLWAEWAKIEALGPEETYTPPLARNDYSGVVISLARQKHPDTGAYDDPEIVWRLDKDHHAGLIVRSGDLPRVIDLLHDYTLRFRDDFHASLPAAAKPTA